MQNIKYISKKAVLIQTSQDTMHMQYMGNVPLILVSLTLVMVNSFPLMVLKVSMPNLMPEKNSDMDSWTEISFSIVSLDFCESS